MLVLSYSPSVRNLQLSAINWSAPTPGVHYPAILPFPTARAGPLHLLSLPGNNITYLYYLEAQINLKERGKA